MTLLTTTYDPATQVVLKIPDHEADWYRIWLWLALRNIPSFIRVHEMDKLRKDYVASEKY